MYCKGCGRKLSEDSNFCEFCGDQIQDMDNADVKEKNRSQYSFSSNIIPSEEGIYRWTYSMSMWKNPTILITIWKVFFLAGMFPVLLVTILELFEQGPGDAVRVFIPMFFGMLVVITVFIFLSYPILIMINGGSYQVVFELNETGVTHIQMQKQFKKNQIVAMISVLAGIAAGNPRTAGAGLLAASKQSSYSEFEKVKKIVTKASRHVIYINGVLEHNQVYVAKEDYEQVKAYILERCKKASVIEK